MASDGSDRPHDDTDNTSGRQVMSKNNTSQRRGRQAGFSTAVKTRTDRQTDSSGISGSHNLRTGNIATGAFGKNAKVIWSLGMKFVTPVLVLVVIVFFVWGFLIERELRSSMLNQILEDGAAKVSNLSNMYGAPLLKARSESYAKSNNGEEFLWPVKQNLIAADEFEKILNERYSKTTREPRNPNRIWTYDQINDAASHASLLKSIIQFGPDRLDVLNPATNQVLDAYIASSGGREKTIIASVSPVINQVRLESDNWLRRSDDLSAITIEDRKVFLKDIDVSVRAGRINRDSASYMTLEFSCPIVDGRREVGVAIVALSADVISSATQKITNIMLTIGLGTFITSLIISLATARIVTRPVRLLLVDIQKVALGDLSHHTLAHSTDEIGQIATAFEEMTRQLQVAAVREKERQQLESEIALTKEIQNNLLPAGLPNIAPYDIAACYEPAKEVGGDYYDFKKIDDNLLGIIIADVSGKGIPASMVVAQTRTVFHYLAPLFTSTAEMLIEMNRIITPDIKRGMFVTALYVIFDRRDRILHLATAGHNPIVIYHAATGKAEFYQSVSGMAIGFDKPLKAFHTKIKEYEIQLEYGDRVILYTDGVNECMSPDNEEYGDQRMLDLLTQTGKSDCKTMMKTLLDDLARHKGSKNDPHDDITMVLLGIPEIDDLENASYNDDNDDDNEDNSDNSNDDDLSTAETVFFGNN